MKRKFSVSSLRLVSAFDSVASLTPLDNTTTPFSPVPAAGPMILDARQNFVLIPCQGGPVSEESSPTDASVVLDSPPYSPSASEIERQVLSSHVLGQLRQSCARIVQQTSPAGHELEDLPDHTETLRRLNDEYERAQRILSTGLRPARRQESRKLGPRIEIPEYSRESSAPYVQFPQNAVTSFEVTTSSRQPFSAPKFEKTTAEQTESANQKKVDSAHRNPENHLSRIRVAEFNFLETSASAGPSANSSTATSRSTTTYGGIAHTTSTGLTSLATTPADPKRASGSKRQSLQNGHSTSLADASAKAWMAQELSRRRAEYENGRTARPATRSSFQHRQVEEKRPASRAGATAAGGMVDSTRDNTRPVRSTETLHPEYHLPRPRSRGGRDHGWRSSGSMPSDTPKSLVNPQLSQQEVVAPDQAEGLDLNRALPPLPGLDQYKEKKPVPIHIAQLMRSTRGERRLESNLHHVSDDRGYPLVTKPLTELDQMRQNAILAASNSGSHPSHGNQHPPYRSATNPASIDLPPFKKQDRNNRYSSQVPGSRRALDPLALAAPLYQGHAQKSSRDATDPTNLSALSSSVRFTQTVPIRVVRPDPSAHSAPAPSVRFTPAPTRGNERDPAPAPAAVPQVSNLTSPTKKQGLRKRLSWFWHHGSDKAIVNGNKGLRRMVAAS